MAASGISRSNIKFGLITHAAAVGALHHEYKLSQHIEFYHTLRNACSYNINFCVGITKICVIFDFIQRLSTLVINDILDTLYNKYIS